MSRMRMMPENGTLSRYEAMVTGGTRRRSRSCGHSDFFQDACEHRLRAVDRQVADVEMPRADIDQRPNRAGADVFGRCAPGELARQTVDRHGQKAVECVQRAWVGAAIVE